MTAIRVAALVFLALGGSALAFRDAFYGLLATGFFAYVDESVFTRGSYPLGELGYSVAAVFVLTTFMQKRAPFAPHPRNLLLLAFWAFCALSAVSSGGEGAARDVLVFSKTVFVALAMTAVLSDPARFRQYLWFMVVVIGFIAAQSGIRGTLAGETGDARYGFHGILSGDRNSTGVYLCTIIPFAFYLLKSETGRRARAFLAVVLVGDVLALVLTYSRGAFIGIMATALFMMGFSRHRLPKAVLAAVLVAVAVYLHAPEGRLKQITWMPAASVRPIPVLPEAYARRISTIGKWDDGKKGAEKSAATRFIIWRSTLAMVADNPLFGVGFRQFEAQIGRYPDPWTGKAYPGRAAHNTPLHVFAELGAAGFALYAALYAGSFAAMGRVKRLALSGGTDRRHYEYARMLQASLVGFFTAGFFNSEPYVDLPWHLLALCVALERFAARGRHAARPVRGAA